METARDLAEQKKMFSQITCISLLRQERETVGKTVHGLHASASLFYLQFIVLSTLGSLATAKAKLY